jgi:uncharacterized protein YjbJ (UPF0337 family)
MEKVSRMGVLAMLAWAIPVLSGCGDNEHGGAQKTKGQVESGVGSFLGDSHLKREGKKDEVVGGVKKTVTDFKDAVHDAVH